MAGGEGISCYQALLHFGEVEQGEGEVHRRIGAAVQRLGEQRRLAPGRKRTSITHCAAHGKGDRLGNGGRQAAAHLDAIVHDEDVGAAVGHHVLRPRCAKPRTSNIVLTEAPKRHTDV